MKERITLTIDREILSKIDGKIDGSKVKNRSHAVELLLLKALSSNRPRKAIILAKGSEGKNSGSQSIASMIEVSGKPILGWNIDLLKRHGVREIMICVSGECGPIKEYAKNGEPFGIKIQYSEQEYPLGTAGSIKEVAEFVTETVIVCNADELKDIDLDDMYEFHKDGNKSLTIALTTVENPQAFGVALMNGARIVTFVEKPSKDNTPSKLINAGLYILEPEVLKYVPDGFSTLEQDLFPKLAAQDRLFGYVFSGQWYPIKTMQDQAMKEWKGL